MGSLSVYGTTIGGCGVRDTIYQVVNSTYGYKWGFSILATGKRAYSGQSMIFYLELVLLTYINSKCNSINRQEPVKN